MKTRTQKTRGIKKALLTAWITACSVHMGTISANASAGGGASISSALELITKFVITGGGLWLVWGVVVLAGGLKDKNGPALQSGIWQIVGGALIIAAAALFASVSAA